jgi:hypothetical protein
MKKKIFLVLFIVLVLLLNIQYKYNIIKPKTILLSEIEIKLPKNLETLSIVGDNFHFYGICINCFFEKMREGTTYITIPIYTTPKNPFPINQLDSYAYQEVLHG